MKYDTFKMSINMNFKKGACCQYSEIYFWINYYSNMTPQEPQMLGNDKNIYKIRDMFF